MGISLHKGNSSGPYYGHTWRKTHNCGWGICPIRYHLYVQWFGWAKPYPIFSGPTHVGFWLCFYRENEIVIALGWMETISHIIMSEIIRIIIEQVPVPLLTLIPLEWWNLRARFGSKDKRGMCICQFDDCDNGYFC